MTTTQTQGFSDAERDAMKARAAELRAEGKKGTKLAEGLEQVLEAIEKMAPEVRALAERVHVTVTESAPQLAPKTWYGMPAYANADGKVVCYFKNADKFGERYSVLGFEGAARLDDGDMWPTVYAVTSWTPAVEAKVAELVRTATA